MSAINSNPARSPFTQFSTEQLLILLLTESRLQTRLLATEFGSEEDLDQLRVEVMNDCDMFADASGATSS